MKIDGACHCGAIAYEAEVDPERTTACHCTDCQELTGTAFRVVVPASEENYRILRGKPKIYIKTTADSGIHRAQAFCGDCGSPLPGLRMGGAFAVVPAGSLDGPAGIRPTAHICCASRAEWDDGLAEVPTLDGLPG